MPDYTLSKAADRDLIRIYRDIFRAFGEARADAYFESLDELLNRLAANSRLGRQVDRIRPGYRRYAHQHHLVYYNTKGGRVCMVRILGSGTPAH